MEADVALRAGAGEAWSMPPTGQSHADATPGRGRKTKAKGRGLPQPVTSQSPQQRSRRKQQQQQQQQLRLSRSLDDELDAAVEAGNFKAQGRQGSVSSSRERLVDSDIVDALLASGASTRRGSAPGQQSPGTSKLEKSTPKEQKKSSSRNRRRRAAAAARKQEVGELEGGEGMAQGPVSPEGPGRSLCLDIQQGRGSRLPEPGNRKQEHRQPSMDSLTGRGPRKHSQQSDDGFFSYEQEYGYDPEEQRLKTPDSPQIAVSEAKSFREQPGQFQAPPGLPRAGFGYQGNNTDGNGRGRRRDKGGMGRMVPKPSGSIDVVPSDISGFDPGDLIVSESMILPEELGFGEKSTCEKRFVKTAHQKPVQSQPLADPHYGKSQGRGGIASDQMYLGDPSLPPRGPNTLSVSSSSAGTDFPPASHPDKPESVVILEVKDRPGMYYKSSMRTVSDTPGVLPGDFMPSVDPTILASSASHFHPQPMSPYQSKVLTKPIGPPRPLVPPQSIPLPQSMVPPQMHQYYSHPGYIPVSNHPHLGYSLPQHSLTPTQLTYSPQLNQSPLMSPQQQMFTPTKGTPLDLSFSPRSTPTAHSAAFAHPMSHLEQVQPAPAHCPPSTSRSAIPHSHVASSSPGLQSKLPGLRRPNLSALQHTVSDDSPLDLSVKKTCAPSNAAAASSSHMNENQAVGGARKLSPETPPPLDLRTNVTDSSGVPSKDTSWSPSTAATTITEQPVGLPRDLIYASETTKVHAAFINEPYTSTTVSQPEQYRGVQLDLTEPPVESQPVSQTSAGSNFTPGSSAFPDHTKPGINISSEPLSESGVTSSLPTASALTPTASAVKTTTSSASASGQPQTESETAGFLNKSEFLQQRAGIKHDDIVVGPRRPISTMVTAQAAKLSDTPNASQSYNTFPPSHSKPGGMHAEDDQKDLSTASGQNPSARNEIEPKITKTSELPSSTQAQDNQAKLPSSSATDHSSSGGSQTIPRRIPRKIQPESPQNPRKKAGGSRLPKPMHGHSPDRNLPAGAKLSLTSSHDEETADNGECLSQPLLTGTNVPTAKSNDKFSKGAVLSPESSSSSDTSQMYAAVVGHTDAKPTAKVKGHSPPSESSNAETNGADSSSHPGKSRQAKAAGKSGLPHAVTNTPPSKRKEAASKLHMLSNIPVPMCHDPRPKPAPQKKQQSVEEDDEEEASDKTPLLRPLTSDAGVENGEMKSQDGASVASSSSSQTTSSKQSFATNGSTTTNFVPVAYSPPANAQTNGISFDRKAESNGEEVGLRTIPEQDSLDHSDTSSQKSPSQEVNKSNSKISSNVKDDSINDQSEPPSPCHVTSDVNPKLRLHRSAEHLGGQNKLSVFQSDAELITSTSATRTEVAASVPSSPGNHGELLKVGSYPTTSSASALLDSSSEAEKSPPIVKKKTNLPRIGILRRGSDRTAEVCRRGSERGIMAGIPLSSRRHDPSVEDLKRATSISELCQSVASLLNIGKFTRI
ncbi:hypothetical protein ElyMa_000887400 [Elysia marginata]|uniref:Uncharacterized protein n=1 Tax=Elysia marginata TaxID=1093978 RepID=A0AAV4H5A6_9GAST|nr:hypothetical protein ElyMa_000887400 [Elysia marginata]